MNKAATILLSLAIPSHGERNAVATRVGSALEAVLKATDPVHISDGVAVGAAQDPITSRLEFTGGRPWDPI